jgi:hypothetical protein
MALTALVFTFLPMFGGVMSGSESGPEVLSACCRSGGAAWRTEQNHPFKESQWLSLGLYTSAFR